MVFNLKASKILKCLCRSAVDKQGEMLHQTEHANLVLTQKKSEKMYISKNEGYNQCDKCPCSWLNTRKFLDVLPEKLKCTWKFSYQGLENLVFMEHMLFCVMVVMCSMKDPFDCSIRISFMGWVSVVTYFIIIPDFSDSSVKSSVRNWKKN